MTKQKRPIGRPWREEDDEFIAKVVAEHGCNYDKVCAAFEEFDPDRTYQSIVSKLAGIRNYEKARLRFQDPKYAKFLENVFATARDKKQPFVKNQTPAIKTRQS